MPTLVQHDACELLDADHIATKHLFVEYARLAFAGAATGAGAPGKGRSRPADQRPALARKICRELTVHAQIEEEIFYPALREVMKDTDLLNEAEVEHASVKDLITQIQEMPEADEMFDARVKVLGEYVDHHVKEEKNEIFPKARAARKLDLVAMREQLETRKAELMGEMEEMA